MLSVVFYPAYSERSLLGGDDEEILETAKRLRDSVERKTHERIFKLHHKWIKSNPPPKNFEEIGILRDAILVIRAFYLDGGTRGYLLKDSEGNYFAFCSGPGFQSEDHPAKIDSPVGSRIFAGALHYANPEARIIESQSDSERFLKRLAERAEAAHELSLKVLGLGSPASK